MGLWLKCPECQAANPLDLKVCTACNASLENLPAARRVYILAAAAPTAPKSPEPQAQAPKTAPAGEATPAASPPAQIPTGGPLVTQAEAPPKKVSKPRASKKKKQG